METDCAFIWGNVARALVITGHHGVINWAISSLEEGGPAYRSGIGHHHVTMVTHILTIMYHHHVYHLIVVMATPAMENVVCCQSYRTAHGVHRGIDPLTSDLNPS